LDRKRFFRFAVSIFAAAVVQVHAQWWNPQDLTPPKYWGTQFAPKVVYTPKVYRDAISAAGNALWNDDFVKLDRMYDELLRDDVRTTDGRSMIEPFAEVFEQAGASPVFDGAMERWAAKSPRSNLRPLAMAVRWEGDAWRARGNAGATQTPDEALQIFRERLGRATKALQDAEPDGKNSPLWYWVALIVAGSTGRPAPQFDALYDEAVRRFPAYLPLYYTRMNYLLPQWGGSFQAVDRFVNDAVSRTRAGEGEALYAWLYADIARKVDGDIFESTLATWPRMKKGFEDMIARHPDAFNRNLYAHFACRIRDRETTARLLAELGKDAQLGNWADGVSTESCKRFALTGV